jgi:hypothetical protein
MTKETWAWLVLWLLAAALPAGLCLALARLAGATWWLAGLVSGVAFVMTAIGLACSALSSLISEVEQHDRTGW